MAAPGCVVGCARSLTHASGALAHVLASALPATTLPLRLGRMGMNIQRR
jgi:hypothetical protein